MPVKLMISLLVVCALLVGGCQDQSVARLQYEAEKITYRAEAAMGAISLRSDVNAQAELRGTFGQALEFCYSALDQTNSDSFPAEHRQISDLTFHCATRLSQMYFAEKSYDSAATVLDELISRVPVSGVLQASAWVNYGRALQAIDHFDSALVVYDRALATFYPPVDSDGSIMPSLFSLPTQMLNIHVRLGDSATVSLKFEEAERYYLKLTHDFPGSEVARAAHTNLAGLYEGESRWNDAIDQLQRLVDPSGTAYANAVIRIAGLLANQLNRPDSALVLYDKLIVSLVGRDTLQMPSLLYHKSQAHLAAQDYDQARTILNDLRNHYPKFYAASPNIQHAIAVTFEAQKNWDRAETEYRYLIEKFPESIQALSSYQHLGDYYRSQRRLLEADHIERDAHTDFQRIARQYSGTILEARALSYQAELFRHKSNWRDAVAILAELNQKFPQATLGRQAAVTAIRIYRNELEDSTTADSLLEDLKRSLGVDETVGI